MRTRLVGIILGILTMAVLVNFGVNTYVALNTRNLLTNGKTTSAIYSKAASVELGQLKTIEDRTSIAVKALNTLIISGKSTGAEEAKRASAAAAYAQSEVTQAETVLGQEIANNHTTGKQNLALLCSLASSLHDTQAVVGQECAT